MDEKTIPLLEASDIECRVQSVKQTEKGAGAILLLYKDARVDMRMLDNIFGASNWQRSHVLINGNLFCNVSVRIERADGSAEWVTKQDVGVESNTQKEKGQASDSFKRACTNWGIGRELYTAPFIYVPLQKGEYKEGKGSNLNCLVRFHVTEINYNDRREICQLIIADEKGSKRFTFGEKRARSAEPEAPAKPEAPAEPKKVYDAARDGALPTCEECGHKIGVYKNKHGEPMNPNKWAEASRKKYKKVLCLDCMKKLAEPELPNES